MKAYFYKVAIIKPYVTLVTFCITLVSVIALFNNTYVSNYVEFSCPVVSVGNQMEIKVLVPEDKKKYIQMGKEIIGFWNKNDNTIYLTITNVSLNDGKTAISLKGNDNNKVFYNQKNNKTLTVRIFTDKVSLFCKLLE